MPRPKQCAYEDSAKGKIESAFWTILYSYSLSDEILLTHAVMEGNAQAAEKTSVLQWRWTFMLSGRKEPPESGSR